MIEVHDYNGRELTEGAHVEGWYDGIPYTATVKEIRPGPGAYRDVILVRDGDSAEVKSFSDAVMIIEEEGV